MKVLCFGYREWSQKIFNNIFTDKEFENDDIFIVTTKKKVKKTFVDNIKPDVILFYGWSWIIPTDIINGYTCLCLHPSPLPKYRGGTPIQNQLANGEKMGAVTIFQMTEKLDDGPIWYQYEMSLKGFISDIFDRVVKLGTKGTLIILKRLKNRIPFSPKIQNEKEATEFKRLKNNSEITVEEIKEKTAEELYDKIRMLSDFYPNAYIVGKDGVKLFIERARLDD